MIQYAVQSDGSFDLTYYRDKHVPLVRETMMPLGMLKGEWDEVLPDPATGASPKFYVISIQYWESLEALERASASPTAKAVRDDVKNFYVGTAVRVISNIRAY